MQVVVSVTKCSTYEREDVCNAVARVIENSNGFPDVNGKRVLIKPNLLTHDKDCVERCVCTHPEVVYAVTKYVIEHGGIPEIADTPGGKVSPEIMKAVYRNCGITKVASEFGIVQNYEIGFSAQPYPEGKVVKSFLIIDPARDADVIISVCKLKTHVLTTYTGAVKNTFGVIPGLHKSLMHNRFHDINDFVNMIIDLNEFITPNYVIMDAIIGMEGDGPNGGSPREIGYLLASNSLYATDVVAQRLINLGPFSVPMMVEAIKRDKINPDDIVIVGDEITPITDYKMPNLLDRPDWKPKCKISQYLGRCHKLLLSVLGITQMYVPMIIRNRCDGCETCVRYCPGQALTVNNKNIQIKPKKCLHCSGCEDVCQKKAIVRDTQYHRLGIITHKLHRYIYSYPKLKPEKCIGCAQCANICSVDAVKIVNKKANFTTSKCIRCYCCHEMCSYSAIEIIPPPWKKILK